MSLALVSELFRVTLDTEIKNAFTVHISMLHPTSSGYFEIEEVKIREICEGAKQRETHEGIL